MGRLKLVRPVLKRLARHAGTALVNEAANLIGKKLVGRPLKIRRRA